MVVKDFFQHGTDLGGAPRVLIARRCSHRPALRSLAADCIAARLFRVIPHFWDLFHRYDFMKNLKNKQSTDFAGRRTIVGNAQKFQKYPRIVQKII